MKKLLSINLMLLLIISLGACSIKDTSIPTDFDTSDDTISEVNTSAEATSLSDTSSLDNENSVSSVYSSMPTYIEEITRPVEISVTISALGDCALGKLSIHGYSGSFNNYYDNYGADYFFSGVQEIIGQDDFTLANLECVLSESDDLVEKAYNIKGHPEYASILTAGSIEGVTLGNNHTFDYGEQSHEDTIDAVLSQGLDYAFNDHYGIYTTEDGITIGYVSSNLCPNYTDGSEEYLKEGVIALKEQDVDIIIACPHWGIEKEHYPTEDQKTLGHELIDLGADLIIGNHTHVLQGIEYYNGKIICYSLANFCFGANMHPYETKTAIYQQTFTFVDGVMQDDLTANIVPCLITSTSGGNDFCPTIATKSWQTIIDNMNTYSSGLSNVHFEDDGTITLN